MSLSAKLVMLITSLFGVALLGKTSHGFSGHIGFAILCVGFIIAVIEMFKVPARRSQMSIFYPVWPVGCGGPITHRANCPHCNQIHERRFMGSFEGYNTWSEEECKFGHHDLCPRPDCYTCLCHEGPFH